MTTGASSNVWYGAGDGTDHSRPCTRAPSHTSAEALAPPLLSVAVAEGPQRREESLSVSLDGRAIVVTEDSLSMVAESLYSGRPVLSVAPAIAQPNANDGAALRGYVERGLLARSPIAGLAAAAFPSRTAAIPDVQAEIAEVVLSLLERPAA